MDDPGVAVRGLRAVTSYEEGAYEVPAADLSPEPDDGWIAAGGLVRSPDGDRFALVRTRWSGDEQVLPGGGVEPEDGSLAATARREIREATGLDVSVEDLLLVERQTLVATDESSRRTTGWFVLFDSSATGTRFTPDPREDEGEILDVGWFADPGEAFAGPSDAVRDVVREETR